MEHDYITGVRRNAFPENDPLKPKEGKSRRRWEAVRMKQGFPCSVDADCKES